MAVSFIGGENWSTQRVESGVKHHNPNPIIYDRYQNILMWKDF
jgi:hypothetical protein